MLEHSRAVREHLDTGAYFADLVRRFEDVYIVSGEEAGDGGTEAGEAGADNDDLSFHQFRWIYMMFEGSGMYLQPTVVGERALLFDVDRGRHGINRVYNSKWCTFQWIRSTPSYKASSSSNGVVSSAPKMGDKRVPDKNGGRA